MRQLNARPGEFMPASIALVVALNKGQIPRKLFPRSILCPFICEKKTVNNNESIAQVELDY